MITSLRLDVNEFLPSVSLKCRRVTPFAADVQGGVDVFVKV